MFGKTKEFTSDYKSVFKDKAEYRVILAELLISLIIYLLILLGLNYLLQNEKKSIEQETEKNLKHSVSTLTDLIDYKLMPTKLREAIWIKENDIFRLNTIKLINREKKKEKLFPSTEFSRVDKVVKKMISYYNYLEFYIISKEGRIIYAANKSVVGKTSSLTKRFPSLLKMAFNGESRFTPIITEDKEFNKEMGIPIKPYPTLFLFVPIDDENENNEGVVAIRITPVNDINFFTQAAYFGKTGEVYMVSDKGLLLTQVRNEEALRKTGLLAKDQFSSCNLYIKDPNVNLLKCNKKQTKKQKKWELTVAAANIQKHKSGFSVKYRNYFGENVIGAWRWDEKLKAGFCAEVSRSEVLSSFYSFRKLIYLLYALIVLISFFFVWFLLHRRRIEKDKVVKQQTFFSEVLNRASSGIITLDEKGKILTFNLEAKKIFNYEFDEVFGEEFKILFTKECREKFDSFDFQEAIQNYSKEKKLVIGVRKEGQNFPLKLIITKHTLDTKNIYIAILEDITEITEAKAALEKSVRLYQKTYSSAPIGIANINGEGKFVSTNEYLKQLLGLNNEEILRATIFDVFEPEKSKFIEDLFYPLFRGEKEKVEAKIKGIIRNGEEKLFSVNCSKVYEEPENVDEFILILDDITEKQKIEDKLREKAKELEEKNNSLEKARIAALSIMQDANIQKEKAEQAFAELERSSFELKKITSAIEQAEVSVIITNKNAKIEYVNPFFTKLTGYSKDEAIGKAPNVLKSGKHDKEFYKDMWDTILNKRVWKGEILNKKKNGELYWEYVTITPLENGEGEISNFIAVKEDITEKKKQDLELKRAKLAAEAATEAKSRFLASMSHEIRTPMNAIIGLTHLALESNPTEKLKNYLGKIASSSKLLLKIINDILDFSKIEAGELSIETTEFNLDEVLRSSLTVVVPKADEKGLEVILDIPQDIPTDLIGDPLRLGQILTNFTNNAVKFTEEGEIVISVKNVRETDTEVELLFAVEDTGIGIKEENKAKLFAPFQQEDISTTRKYGGTGLGLVISKRMAELMGGKTWFESAENVGSVFYVQIPFGKQSLFSRPKVHILNPMENKTILICEKNDKVSYFIGKIARSFGLKVLSSENCTGAFEKQSEKYFINFNAAIIDYEILENESSESISLIRQKSNDNLIVICSLSDLSKIENLRGKFLDFKTIVKPVLPSEIYNALMSLWGEGIKVKYKSLRKKDKETETAGLNGIKILLAEDNEINQEVARELLSSYGVEVEIANNGAEAVEMVAKSGNPSKYALVLMDIQMPYMDGFTATREIKKIKEYKDLPVIAMTADAMQGVKEQCFAAGMVDYLTKPIEQDKLFAALVKWTKISGEHLNNQTTDKIGKEPNVLISREKNSNDLIDFSEALRFVGNNEKLLNNLLEKFIENYSDFEIKINDLWYSEEKEEVLRLVHTLKGNSGTLGMKKLFNTAAEVHSKLLRKEDIELEQTFSPLFVELKKVLELLKEKESVKEKGIEENVLKDFSEVKEKLEKLIELLDTYDSEAVALAEEIGIIKSFEEESKKLFRLVKSYKFDEAMEIINKIFESK